MDGRYLQGGEEMIFSRSDIDVVLPALENSTQRKFNSSFSAEQRKYENLEKQIQRERKDVNQRLMLEKKDFVRNNLFLKERKKLSSRRTARRKERDLEKPVSREALHLAEMQEEHSTVYAADETQLPRSPYYFPPLYKNVEKDMKEIQTCQAQMDLAKKEPVNTASIKHCRYLRLSFAQRQEIKTENSDLESDVEQNPPHVAFFNDNEPC